VRLPHRKSRRAQHAPKAPLSREATRARAVRRRRIAVVSVVVLIGLLIPVGISFGQTVTDPAYGSSFGARAAEWFRGHGGATVVNWFENVWYSHHQPPVGGKPPAGSIKVPTTQVGQTYSIGLPQPAPITPLASPPIAGEGQWSPVGRSVDGVPTVYATELRPDPVHTSQVVGVAWMDTQLLQATLYSGSIIPGGGPYSHTAPISPTAANSLVAAFNAGFLMSASNGGYYTDGQTVVPLRTGAASFVIYSDGSMNIGAWGSDVTMTKQVVSVRQNLDLLVNNGQPVPGLNAADTTQWGATLGNQVYVWRSGVGVTADGALVYVGGPSLNITSLANVLVAAGCVRAMELDINTDWVNLATYNPGPNQPASPTNGADLLSSMSGGPDRYFQSYWARDFFTMSIAPTYLSAPASGATPSSSPKTTSPKKTTTAPSG
jgi:uncharacterized protein YigE (DUF2233 family)